MDEVASYCHFTASATVTKVGAKGNNAQELFLPQTLVATALLVVLR